jgi:serine/threonine-protein kinase
VPFAGSNGPSILLEILTKDPKPPSEVGRGQKYPVPPTLDPVMAHAFKKMQALRTESVGALADDVARAYGLDGSHTLWATVPEGEIAAKIEAKMPELMATKVVVPAAPADASDSFFGESDALGAGAPGGAALPPVPASRAPAPAPASRASAAADLAAAGIPTGAPSWLPIALVGGGALLVGVIIVLLLALR